MKVLLATDGSAQADIARSLVAWVDWPAGTAIHVVRAVGVLPPSLELSEDRRFALNARLEAEAEEQVAAAVATLARHRRIVTQAIIAGDPVAAILGQAEAFGADVIVVGGRRLGALERTLLGSTSSALLDRSTRPLLIARRPRLGSLLFAEDGSPCAHDAASIVARWPIFSGLPAHVVSVVHAPVMLASGVAPTMHRDAIAAYHDSIVEARRQHRAFADETAEWFRRSGLLAAGEVREGEPADVIVAAADESRADLIVLGTRGQRGLTRLVLGSVARGVLERAEVSVLVVPPGAARS